MDEATALARFAGTDETTAIRALDRLCELTRGFLHGHLRARGIHSAQDREDIIQMTYCKVLAARSRFRNDGIAAWREYLKRIAEHSHVDFVRERHGEIPAEEMERRGVPEDDRPTVEALLAAASAVTEAERLYRRADTLWLGLDPGMPPETHDRQLLAAQLFYLEDTPWEEITDLLATGPSVEPPLTRDLLDRWLTHPGVLRLLAYHTLYYSNDRLAACLLGLPEPAAPYALDALMRLALMSPPDASPPAGWTWPEVAVLLWRIRHAMLLEQILSRNDCAFPREELLSLLDRLAGLFPFNQQMQALLRRLQRGAGAGEALKAIGLWQRLAFQYRYHDDLPHQDIVDRTQPAASQVGYEVTRDKLNAWLSNGRLLAQLARFCADTQKGATDG